MFTRKRFSLRFGFTLFSGIFLMGQIVLLSPCSAYELPDTGQTICYDDTQEIECPSPGQPFYGQDARYDTSFPSYSINGDIVSDILTGQMWQKTDDDVMRIWSDAITYCEDLTLGDHDDWRLPSEDELQAIVDYGQFDPAIDTTYFPGTDSVAYWSSTTFANDAGSAWAIRWDDGLVGGTRIKSSPSYVRCVRGESIGRSFIDNGNGTVTETVTGLMWQQEDDNQARNWEAALGYCENLDFGGHGDWRLPNAKELRTIVDNTRYNPVTDPVYFPGTNPAWYWSSTTGKQDGYLGWGVYFLDGQVNNYSKTAASFYSRCVRCGVAEVCGDGDDNDCDGLIDDADTLDCGNGGSCAGSPVEASTHIDTPVYGSSEVVKHLPLLLLPIGALIGLIIRSRKG